MKIVRQIRIKVVVNQVFLDCMVIRKIKEMINFKGPGTNKKVIPLDNFFDLFIK